MPPCAAIECARRGESWKQKQLTRYPSSESDADALAPASPDPTTITLYFRLFAGFTSFISKRCLSHFSASGPAGILGLSLMVMCMSGSANQAEHDAQRKQAESHGNDDRERQRKTPVQRIVRRARDAERAKHRPRTVIEMQREKCNGAEIEKSHPDALETDHDISVRLPSNK